MFLIDNFRYFLVDGNILFNTSLCCMSSLVFPKQFNWRLTLGFLRKLENKSSLINNNQLVVEEREKLVVKLSIIVINWLLKLDSGYCLGKLSICCFAPCPISGLSSKTLIVFMNFSSVSEPWPFLFSWGGPGFPEANYCRILMRNGNTVWIEKIIVPGNIAWTIQFPMLCFALS